MGLFYSICLHPLTHTTSLSSFQDSLSVPCSPMHFSVSDPPMFHSSVPNHLCTKPLSLSLLLYSLSQHPPQLQTTKVNKQIPDVHQLLHKATQSVTSIEKKKEKRRKTVEKEKFVNWKKYFVSMATVYAQFGKVIVLVS